MAATIRNGVKVEGPTGSVKITLSHNAAVEIHDKLGRSTGELSQGAVYDLYDALDEVLDSSDKF